MNYSNLFSRLRVASHYSIHIVESDAVVVLYNRKRPLLLKGDDKVRLFSYIKHLQAQENKPNDDINVPEDLIPLVALLLKQNILEYLDESLSKEYHELPLS